MRLMWIALRRLGLAVAIIVGLGVGDVAGAQTRGARIDVQATNSRQAELLERALAELKPVEHGQTHLYFVGFAGYGPAAVFKREVLAVRKMFDQRFGTKTRSIALINHESTLTDIPLASVGNLERVLVRLGKLMDTDHSILFLFLTSHGRKGVLTVEMPGFGLSQLTPGRLKEMLKRSGIKHSVIVVSACHSGSFVPALGGPTTLVITAAHADRTSFGCGDKNEWTVFGNAFFNVALRWETSFTRAFAQAKQHISLLEATAKLPASLPQMAGGEALASRLQAIELNTRDAETKGAYDRAVADFYIGRGAAYLSKGDNDRAIADLTKAIEIDPKYAAAYNSRGNAYRDRKDYDQAIADHTRAIEIDPKYAAAYNNRGNAYRDKKDYDQAIADYTTAIEIDPKYAAAYNNRGNAYRDKKD